MFMRILDMLTLVRFEHALIYVFAIFFTILALNLKPSISELIPVLAVPVFCEFGSFALNDFLDIESDKRNKKKRPLVLGHISKKEALNIIWFSYIISITFGFFLNTDAFAFALSILAFSVIYNFRLKDLPLVGNIYIAFSMAAPFIYTCLAFQTPPTKIILFATLVSFEIGLAREIVKTVQDFEGDKKARNSHSLPYYIGAENSLFFASLLYFAAVMLTFTFIKVIEPNLSSLLLLSFSALGFLTLTVANILFSQSQRYLKASQKASLVLLVFGLLGLFSLIYF